MKKDTYINCTDNPVEVIGEGFMIGPWQQVEIPGGVGEVRLYTETGWQIHEPDFPIDTEYFSTGLTVGVTCALVAYMLKCLRSIRNNGYDL